MALMPQIPPDVSSGSPSPAALGDPSQAQPSDPSAPMSPEHKDELTKLLDLVKNDYSKWQSLTFSLQNRVAEAKRDELKKVFQLLSTQGVDLTDQASVSQFLDKVKQESPENYDAITKALDGLLGTTNYENEQQPQQAQPEDSGAPELPPQM